jgi:DNA (cytosine-5)-methyltransferase 1
VKKALDLFCGAGGASMGLYLAGYEVTGVDLHPQPNYPFTFIQADALEFPLEGYDLIWASPPCQMYSQAQKIQGRVHPDLVGPVRERLKKTGTPYIIENVIGSPLINPVMLCGAMFPELNVYRHRLFECSFPVEAPPKCDHKQKQTKMGRPPQPGERMQIIGNWSGIEEGKKAMGIDWMNRNEMSEAIPPAYAKWIVEQL